MNMKRIIKRIDSKNWKRVPVEFGRQIIEVSVPPECVELSMNEVPIISDPASEFERALSDPIGSPTLEEIVRNKNKPPAEITVAIAVSDITRPVPYKGDNGMLNPLLRRLLSTGIRKENVKIIVATGMHRPSTREEKAEMYGQEIVGQYTILDHDCENNDLLESIGKTKRDTHVFVNRDFYFADLKIVTGLIESHFFTGVSGGRKSVCPGLVDVKTIQKSHGPVYLEDPNSTNLVLEGNPCHEEALEVATTVGVDFILNTTLDKDLNITGVYAGHLEKAHMRAYDRLRACAEIPLDRQFDIVLTHSGYVGRDHYQTAKAGVGAIPAVKVNGTIIIAANNRDMLEPIGSPQYKSLLHLLKLQGTDGFLSMIQSNFWKFTKDQWEPEVWGRVLRKVGEDGLIYCSLEIKKADYCLLPGHCGLDFLEKKRVKQSLEVAREMVQGAVYFAMDRCRQEGYEPSMAFIKHGPYAVPTYKEHGA